MYTYTITKIADLPRAPHATFIFTNSEDLPKLATNPNITMQLGTFDEDLPVIVVVPGDEVASIYERACGPNTYILILDKKTCSWQYVFSYLLTEPDAPYKTALFTEWNVLLSNAKTGVLYNMRKNPNYFWEGVTENLDYSDWFDNMEQTMIDNHLCSVGVDRRHGTDLVTLMNAGEEYHYPIQLVMYDFDALRRLKVSRNSGINATNSVVRDTLIDLAIRDAGGATDTVPIFHINTPSVHYTEEDLHAIINLPAKYPALFRRVTNADIRARK